MRVEMEMGSVNIMSTHMCAHQVQKTRSARQIETGAPRTVGADIVARPIAICRAHGVQRVRGRARPVPPNQLHGEQFGASAAHVQEQRDEEHERPPHVSRLTIQY